MASIDPNTQTRVRAYYIWESDGRAEGRALEHWLRAETELAAATKPGTKARRTSKSAACLSRAQAEPSEPEEQAARPKPARRRSKPKKRS